MPIIMMTKELFGKQRTEREENIIEEILLKYAERIKETKDTGSDPIYVFYSDDGLSWSKTFNKAVGYFDERYPIYKAEVI